MKGSEVNGPALRPGCGVRMWWVFTLGVEDPAGPGVLC